MITQESMVLDYLLSGNTITPLQALDKFHSFRLSSIIHRLRHKGYTIDMKLVGEGKQKYAEYNLIRKEPSRAYQSLQSRV